MSRKSVLPWILLAVWAVWIFGLQASLAGSFASASRAAPWMPDLGLVLALALAARLPTQDLPLVGLCVGLARAAVTIDPPAAVLVAYLGLVAVVRALRSVVEIKSPPATFVVAVLLSLATTKWLQWVHDARAMGTLGVDPSSPVAAGPLGDAWKSALATGLAAALLAPALARLPGLSPLHRRTAWRVGASSR